MPYPITRLHRQLRERILSFLPLRDLRSMSQVCRTFRQTSHYLQARTPISTPPPSRTSSPSSSVGGSTTTTDPNDCSYWAFVMTQEIHDRISALPKLENAGKTLSTIPTELLLEIFTSLDPIDACCLGLSHPRIYTIYRSVHGIKLPLNTRRSGPNTLESAWEVVGKERSICRHCGIYRCELHMHIKDWMPEDLEYCSMKVNFGKKADSGVKEFCHRGKPSKPRRCGRHPKRTTTLHQDDFKSEDANSEVVLSETGVSEALVSS